MHAIWPPFAPFTALSTQFPPEVFVIWRALHILTQWKAIGPRQLAYEVTEHVFPVPTSSLSRTRRVSSSLQNKNKALLVLLHLRTPFWAPSTVTATFPSLPSSSSTTLICILLWRVWCCCWWFRLPAIDFHVPYQKRIDHLLVWMDCPKIVFSAKSLASPSLCLR